MQCPACHRPLSPVIAGGVTVDACTNGCGGLWFDCFELRKFDEPHEHQGETLLSLVTARDPSVDCDRRRTCPRCAELPMMRHFWSAAHEVEIDECPGCGGVWLDGGELETIRGLFTSEDEQRAATAALIRSAFGEAFAEGDPYDPAAPENADDPDDDANDRRLRFALRLGRVFGFLSRRPAA